MVNYKVKKRPKSFNGKQIRTDSSASPHFLRVWEKDYM